MSTKGRCSKETGLEKRYGISEAPRVTGREKKKKEKEIDSDSACAVGCSLATDSLDAGWVEGLRD